MIANDNAMRALGKALRARLGAAGDPPVAMQALLLRLALVDMRRMAAARDASRNPAAAGDVVGPDNRSGTMSGIESDDRCEPAADAPRSGGEPQAPQPDTLTLPVPHRTSA